MFITTFSLSPTTTETDWESKTNLVFYTKKTNMQQSDIESKGDNQYTGDATLPYAIEEQGEEMFWGFNPKYTVQEKIVNNGGVPTIEELITLPKVRQQTDEERMEESRRIIKAALEREERADSFEEIVRDRCAQLADLEKGYYAARTKLMISWAPEVLKRVLEMEKAYKFL